MGNRDLSAVGLVESQALIFAPSGDLTDDPDQMNLYISDSGSGNILELALTEPLQATSTAEAVLVNTIQTWQFSPASPDPAGLAYLNSSDSLLMSDSEVNEVAIFTGDNLFELDRSGFLLDTGSTLSYSQ